MNVLILDNYDSFTYNLVQYVEELIEQEITVKRNDEISVEEVNEYDVIILSPGPGLPKDAGIMPEVLAKYSDSKKILGVCLGHQAIIENFGGEIYNLDKVFHGVATEIVQTDYENTLFNGLPNTFKAGRYHSWVGENDSFPEELIITAVDDTGEIMALKHKTLPIYAVQFHPESIMTPYGRKMLANFFGIEYELNEEEQKRLENQV